MKKTFKLLAASLFVLFAAACAKTNLVEEQPELIPEGFVKLEITAESETTKTAVDADGNVTWCSGDEVKFLYSGGTATATTTSTTASATFTAIVPDSGNLYAVYPSSIGTLTSDVITVNVPATQDGAFANGNFSAAKVNRGTNSATFQNITSFLKVTVSNPSVKRVVVECAGTGVSLAGAVDVTFTNYDISVGDCSEGSGQITLNVPGIGTYYIAVLPGVTHSKGLSITYYTEADGVYTALTPYYYNKSLTVERNKIKDFGVLNPTPGSMYVSVAGAGNKSGFTADNAMSFEQWKTRVTAIEDLPENTYARTSQAKSLDGTTFNFAAGTYSFTEILPLGTYSMIDARNVAYTIQGAAGTIFSGASSDVATYSILQINSVVDLTIKNVTFDKAKAIDTNRGGALYLSNNSSTVTLDGCTFSNCVSSDGGSGAAVTATTGEITATNCTFTSNSADVGAGLNIYKVITEETIAPVGVFTNCTFTGNSNSAVRVQTATCTFNACTFQNNTNTVNTHGTLCCQAGSVVNVNGCTFSGNSAKTGGAIFAGGNAQLTIGDYESTNTTFSNNSAANWESGAIHFQNTSTATITNAQFTGNTAVQKGGASNINTSGNISFVNCTFDGNKITSTTYNYGNNQEYAGGTLYLQGSADVSLTNCTLKNSISNYYGSTIYTAVGRASGTLTITGGSFQNNGSTASGGGAITLFGSSPITISGTTFSGNFADYGGCFYSDYDSDLTCTECVFNGNYTFTDGKSWKYYGGVYYNSGSTDGKTAKAKFNKCYFSGNYANGGGAIYLKQRVDMYVNNSVFKDNYIKYKCGTNIAISATSAKLYMNNCTLFGGYTTVSANNDGGSTIYNKGVLFISNSTYVGDPYHANKSNWHLTTGGMICNDETGGKIYLVNNIIAGISTDTQSLYYKAVPGTSEVYYNKMSNVYHANTVISTVSPEFNGLDYYQSSFGNMAETTDTDYRRVWSWDGTMTGTNNTCFPLADVKTFISTNASDFNTWLGTVDGLDKDQLGNVRGANTWPGSYDGTNL
jgi:predicted outer membrane repeat protein